MRQNERQYFQEFIPLKLIEINLGIIWQEVKRKNQKARRAV